MRQCRGLFLCVIRHTVRNTKSPAGLFVQKKKKNMCNRKNDGKYHRRRSFYTRIIQYCAVERPGTEKKSRLEFDDIGMQSTDLRDFWSVDIFRIGKIKNYVGKVDFTSRGGGGKQKDKKKKKCISFSQKSCRSRFNHAVTVLNEFLFTSNNADDAELDNFESEILTLFLVMVRLALVCLTFIFKLK